VSRLNLASFSRAGRFERAKAVSPGNPLNTSADARGGVATVRWQLFRQVRDVTRGWRVSTATIGGRWSTGRHSGPPEGGNALVAENARGQAVSAWEAGSGGKLALRTAYRPGPAAPWGPKRTISPQRQGGGGDPQVMIDARGVATVVWVRAIPAHENDDDLQVMATTRRPSGRLETVAVTPDDLSTSHPSLAANARGDAVVAYNVCTPAVFDNLSGECATWNGVQAAVRPAGASAFGPSQPVSLQADGSGSFITAAMRPSGQPLVTWRDDVGLRLAQPAASGPWSIATVSATAIGGGIIAGDAVGRGLIAWQEGAAGGGNQSIWATAVGSDGSLGTAQQISDVTLFNQDPRLAVSASGRALLVWSRAAAPGSISLEYATTRLG
jgi:hypothetical protein